MKIAMITDDYPPNIGGIAAHVYELSRALQAEGHEIQVYFWDPEKRNSVEHGIVPVEFLQTRKQGSWPRGFFKSFPLLRELRSIKTAFTPDIMHLHAPAPLSLAMRWLGSDPVCRRVFTNHSSGYLYMIRRPGGRIKARFYCGAFEGLIAPSDELLRESLFLGIPESNCRYIPNGVDLDRFSPKDRDQARKELNLPRKSRIILATRRFVVKNGLRFLARALIDVVKEIQNVQCIFCGSAGDEQELPAVKNIIAANGLEKNVTFSGPVPNTEIPLYLAACDLMVLPSLVEATSISCLEAMAMARPVIGTKTGGIPALIAHGQTGLLVNPGDSEELAAAIVKALRDLDLQEMGRAARKTVEKNFSWAGVGRKTLEFYEEILKFQFSKGGSG